MVVFVAEQASLSLTWSETHEDTFSHDEAHISGTLETRHFLSFIYFRGEFIIKYICFNYVMCGVKRIWYVSPMRAAKVQASLRIHAVSPEPPLLAHTSSESRGTFRQKARYLAPLNGWACAVKICHGGMLEDTNSLDALLIMGERLQTIHYCLLHN